MGKGPLAILTTVILIIGVANAVPVTPQNRHVGDNATFPIPSGYESHNLVLVKVSSDGRADEIATASPPCQVTGKNGHNVMGDLSGIKCTAVLTKVTMQDAGLYEFREGAETGKNITGSQIQLNITGGRNSAGRMTPSWPSMVVFIILLFLAITMCVW